MREVWEYVLRINETGAQYFQPNIAISITHSMLHHMLHRLLQMVCGADANRLFDGLMAFCETKTGTINNEELEKARAAAQRQFVSTMGSSLGRAINLSQSAIFYNDPGRFATAPERIAKVTAADVQRVASKYFTPANRTVVVTTPKGVRP